MTSSTRRRLRVPRWWSGMSLRYRLPLSYAGLAILTTVVLGLILFLVVQNYYGRAETNYLNAGAERVLGDLSDIDWASLTATGSSESSALALQRTKATALATQLRVVVVTAGGTVSADSGSAQSIDPATVVQRSQQQGTGGARPGPTSDSGSPLENGPPRGLPSPLGPGLFGGDQTIRSSRSIERPLAQNGVQVASVRLSEGPAYGSTIIRTTVRAWLLAGLAAVVLAAVLGWLVSRRITQPLLRITSASDTMARGDLSSRTDVQRRDEIGRLAESFNHMAGRVQHTVSALQQFVADAAHELGTPLTALQADLDLAQARSANDAQRRLVDRAMGQAQRLERLSASLLQLSRLDTTELSDTAETVELSTLVRHLADSFASRAEQAQIDLKLECGEEPINVLGHEQKLRAAITNLLDNALKFTPTGGSITFGLKEEHRKASIWVADSGIGIPEEDMPKLFGRFHRGRNAASYPGSGLGLAIVKATMDLHGGTVSASSSSTGSRFDLVLPVL